MRAPDVLRSIAIACALCAAPALSHAAAAVNPVDALCKDPTGPSQARPDKAEFFPEMRAAAVEVRRSVCVLGVGEEGAIRAVLGFMQTEASQQRLKPFGYTEEQNPLRKALDGVDVSRRNFPVIGRTIGAAINVDGVPIAPADADACDRAAARVLAGKSCRDALNEFVDLYTYVHMIVEQPGLIAFSKSAATLTREWDGFLKNTRSQTVLELAVNSYLYRRHEPTSFASPPGKQIILFHPDVVMENIDAALEGDKTKEALMVEVLGLNWWSERPWYVPSGGSAVALYSDRAGASDVGYGLAVHFKGVYTIGYAYHGHHGGVFISGDLLKIFADKKNIVASYLP